MTKPQGNPRRLGFSGYSGNARTVAELTPAERKLIFSQVGPSPDLIGSDAPRHFAQFKYLRRLAELHKDVLVELKAIRLDDAAALDAWAHHWYLIDDWCLAYARPTMHFWRDFPASKVMTWIDRDDLGGMWVPDVLRPGDVRPLYTAEHFDWLIHFQLTGNYSDLAAKVKVKGESKRDGTPLFRPNSSVQREACEKLAGYLQLTLRTTKPGRRPKS
jgi:hypothetical protein